MPIQEIKHNPTDLLRQVNPSMYAAAYKKGMSLSRYLDKKHRAHDPNYPKLDTFELLMREAGLITRSSLYDGVSASTWDDFASDPQIRALAPEWISRLWRAAQDPKAARQRLEEQRALYTSEDHVPGSFERPYVDAASGRWDKQIAPAIPVSALVAMESPINGDAYRSYYLANDPDAQRTVRVGQGAKIPAVKLVGGEHTIRLSKFGRALHASYEELRRQRLDRISLHIARMAVQSEVDKVAVILDTLVNGDGNSGTAATVHALTALDTGATAGTLTLKAWLAFKMKFANPYTANVALARDDMTLQLLMLSTGSSSIPLVTVAGQSGFGGFSPINPGLNGTLGLGWTSDAPASNIVAFDARWAVERVVEIGANIQEVTRFITTQTQVLTMTEVEGYGIIDGNATRILNVGA